MAPPRRLGDQLVEPLPLGPLEGPAYETVDPAFAPLVLPDVRVERIWTGGKWVEGPAWLAESGLLVWSDIPNNRMLAWREASGEVSVFRAPANGANGNTVDREGRLVTCEQYTRRITRTEPDGRITVLADRYRGKRFNAPNDIVVKSDGSVWFTDPDYGRSPLYEGKRELDGCHVYRIDPATGAVRQMTDDMVMPNGLAFSPDESLLYVVDTGSTHVKGGPNHVRRFRLSEEDRLAGGEVIATNAAEKFDGFRLDTEGRLWMGAEDGVHIHAPDGALIARLRLPERVSNLTFGGADGGWLLMTGTTSIYRCRVVVRGAGRPSR
jgi:gluconolactonase